MAVTQKKLAELLGIDRTTVTKALSDSPTISDELKARVKSLSKELGYKPNYHSRSLRTRETKVISVLKIGLGLSHLHSHWITSIQRWAFDAGYKIRLESMPDIATTLAEQSADGFISFHRLSELSGPSLVSGLGEVPLVFTDCGISDHAENAVAVDNAAGMGSIAKHLVQEGHSKVAFFGMVESSGVCRDRYAGFVRQLNDSGLSLPGDRVIGIRRWIEEPAEVEDYRDRLLRLVESGVTGIAASSDNAAVGIVKFMRRQGIRVPLDMAVTGFDDSLAARVCEPALTSVRQDIDTAAGAAVNMLLAIIREGKSQANVVVPAELVVRESTVER